MQKKTLALAITMILLTSMFLMILPIPLTSANPSEILVPTDYLTIQEAINAANPGDTIIVAEGTYVGALVYKNVIIIGASEGASVIDNGVPYKDGSSLLTAFRLNASADGAEIRSFTVDCNSSDNFYFAVFSRKASDIIIDFLTINDAVQGITNWGGSNWSITNNVLTNTEAAGGGGIAIWLGAYPPDYPTCSGNLIQNNTITAMATAPDFTCPGIGVGLDLRWGGYDDLTGNEDISNNQILNNNISAPGALNGVGVEIGVLGLEGNTTRITAVLGTIHDNTIMGNTIEGADLGVYFYTVANLTIQQNEIKNNTEGIHIKDGTVGNVVNYNSIFDNGIGFNNTAEQQVDARFNWWGHDSGPSGVGPGIGDAISENVTYNPWFGCPLGTTPMTYHVNPTGTIQEAIDEASPGDTILVHTGTYYEALYINKTVTVKATSTPVIKGSKLFVTDYGNREAVIFVKNAEDVVLEDLNIEGEGLGPGPTKSYGILCQNSSGTVRNCTVSPNTIGDMYSVGIAAISRSNLLIEDCVVENFGRIGVYATNVENIAIQKNKIIGQVYDLDNLVNYGIEIEDYDGASTAEIVKNEIYNCDNTHPSPLWSSAAIIVDIWRAYYNLSLSTVSIEENDIHDNYEAIEIISGNLSYAHNNNIYDNKYGVWNYPDLYGNNGTFDARFNWWGNETGPDHSTLNPSGTGDNVSDHVNFDHWLLQPCPPPILSPVLYIAPANVEYWTQSYGETFAVNVKIDNVTDLLGFEFKLYWNTTLLDLTGVQVTPPWGSFMTAKNETNEALGRYWLSITGFGVPTFNGSTTLATLTFKITYDPIHPDNRTCKIDLTDTKLSAPNGVPIYHMTYDGEYSIYSTRPKIEVTPSTYTVHALGETFTVNITVSDVVNLYNFTFKLSYNTTLLDVLTMQIGTFLDTPLYTYKFTLDDADGYVYLWIWSLDGAAPANGSGVLATITFKASKATTWTQLHSNILSCSLHLYDTMLKTNLDIEIPHDTVDGTYYYEPKPGDLDSDGCVGLTDLRIVAYYYDPAYNPIADLNEDSIVDIYDVVIVATHYGEDC